MAITLQVQPLSYNEPIPDISDLVIAHKECNGGSVHIRLNYARNAHDLKCEQCDLELNFKNKEYNEIERTAIDKQERTMPSERFWGTPTGPIIVTPKVQNEKLFHK